MILRVRLEGGDTLYWRRLEYFHNATANVRQKCLPVDDINRTSSCLDVEVSDWLGWFVPPSQNAICSGGHLS